MLAKQFIDCIKQRHNVIFSDLCKIIGGFAQLIDKVHLLRHADF